VQEGPTDADLDAAMPGYNSDGDNTVGGDELFASHGEKSASLGQAIKVDSKDPFAAINEIANPDPVQQLPAAQQEGESA